MHSLLTAILILSASGSAHREMRTDETIAGIVSQTGIGAAKDVLGSDPTKSSGRLSGMVASKVRFTIDGRPRSGISGWGEGLWRVGGYATDLRTDGSVGLSYSLRIRRYDIATSTSVTDEQVIKTLDVYRVERIVIPIPKPLQRLLGKKQIIRDVPIHVTITITATESEQGTVLVGSAVGTADTRDFRCGLIRGIADRRAANALRTGLAAALLAVEQQGTAWFHAGKFSPAIDDVRDQVRRALNIQLLGGRR